MKMSEALINFCNRPHVYITKLDYSNHVDFITGLMIGNNTSKIFISFLQEKYKTHFSVHWSIYILNELSSKNEKIALEKLFALIKDFSSSMNN